MTHVLIVPGLHNSGENHWQTLWEKELPNTLRVVQDDWETPDIEQWANRIIQTSRQVDRFWIVAHSFGVLSAVHALPDIVDRVNGLFLVAPASPVKLGVDRLLSRKILPVPGVIVASRSDPWLSWEGANQLSNDWGLSILDAGYAGHINVESGHGHWQYGLDWFDLFRDLKSINETIPLHPHPHPHSLRSKQDQLFGVTDYF